MAAAPATAWVYSEGRDSFAIPVPDEGIRARSLRALIEASPTGKDMLFAAGSWGVFLAPEGTKQGAKLGDLTLITPTAGEVNVWVERVVAPAAGGASGGGAGGGALGDSSAVAGGLASAGYKSAPLAGYPKRTPLPSPGTASAPFINGKSVAIVPSPVLLRVSPRALDAGWALAGHYHRLKCTYELSMEGNFYQIATEVLPAFATQVGEPIGDMMASTLFGLASRATQLWFLPLDCKPELHVRSAGGAGGVLCPGWNGEVKSADKKTTLDQAALYTVMDMVRVFFPAGAEGDPQRRRFYATPPVGYALAAYPHVGYLLALEWVGVVCVSVASAPFILGSNAHRKAVARLDDVRYEPARELDAGGGEWLQPLDRPIAGSTTWRVKDGRFEKVVRFNAYLPATFVQMARVYSALQQLHAEGATAPPGVVLDCRLWYGEHEVLVDMEAVAGAQCSDDDIEADASVRDAVAAAVAWMAIHGILLSDLRGPNVLRSPTRVAVIDYDDAFWCEEPVLSYADFLEQLRARQVAFERGEGPLVAAAAQLLLAGERPQFAAALEAAFGSISTGAGAGAGLGAAATITSGSGAGAGAGAKRRRSDAAGSDDESGEE